MKQFPIGDSLYAFVVAYNIAMKEQQVEESDQEYYDYINDKTDLIWDEIGNLCNEFNRLKQRVDDLENRPQVQPPSKMYPDWNNPNWTVTCGTGTITTNNDQPYQYDFSDLHKMTEGKYYTGWQPEPKQKGLYD